MLYVEHHHIDTPLAELSQVLCRWCHDRLFSPSLRRKALVHFQLFLPDQADQRTSTIGLLPHDVISQRYKRRLVPPDEFDIALPSQSDALEMAFRIAHAWITIAQLASGRLMFTGKPGRAAKISAVWLGVPIGRLQDIPHDLRPWEQEALAWQHQLVAEFIDWHLKEWPA